jgi:hypothetical protein
MIPKNLLSAVLQMYGGKRIFSVCRACYLQDFQEKIFLCAAEKNKKNISP